jgi:enoyl-CoA hydratase
MLQPAAAQAAAEELPMNSEALFKVEIEESIAWLTLNRPEKRNAMGFAFFEALRQHLRRFDRDPNVRVIILKAAGPGFTAGTDLTEAGELVQNRSADGRENLRRKILELQQSLNELEKCRKPVIAAVHGHCIGGGVDLLCACDIRLATRDAVFSIRETRIGIIADIGTLQRLPPIIGEGWFRELALTGRDFGAEEALQMRFITHLCENRDQLYRQARDIAEEILACPPLTVEGVKDVILYSRDHGVYPGLAYVAQKNAAALPSEDLFEAVTAFMEKRAPVFKGK